jgi:hypothetical protein
LVSPVRVGPARVGSSLLLGAVLSGNALPVRSSVLVESLVLFGIPVPFGKPAGV